MTDSPVNGPYGQWIPPAPKPGVIPLRPLTVGEILDGAFTAVRRNPKATLGLAAIVMTVNGVLTALIGLITLHAKQNVHLPAQGQPLTTVQAKDLAAILIPAVLGTAVVQFVVDTFLTGVLTAVIGHSMLGRQVTIAQAWRIARPRIWAVIGSLLLEGLILAGLLVAGILPGLVLILAHSADFGALLLTLGVLAAIVLGIITVVRFGLATPAVLLEGQGPRQSLARSWRLTRGSSWRVFGIMVLTSIVVGIAGVVIEIPFDIISFLAGRGAGNTAAAAGFFLGSGNTVAGILISAVGTIVAGAVTRPVLAGTMVLLYTDLRMRREGLDIALQPATGRPEQASGGLDAFDAQPPRW